MQQRLACPFIHCLERCEKKIPNKCVAIVRSTLLGVPSCERFCQQEFWDFGSWWAASVATYCPTQLPDHQPHPVLSILPAGLAVAPADVEVPVVDLDPLHFAAAFPLACFNLKVGII